MFKTVGTVVGVGMGMCADMVANQALMKLVPTRGKAGVVKAAIYVGRIALAGCASGYVQKTIIDSFIEADGIIKNVGTIVEGSD